MTGRNTARRAASIAEAVEVLLPISMLVQEQCFAGMGDIFFTTRARAKPECRLAGRNSIRLKYSLSFVESLTENAGASPEKKAKCCGLTGKDGDKSIKEAAAVARTTAASCHI